LNPSLLLLLLLLLRSSTWGFTNEWHLLWTNKSSPRVSDTIWDCNKNPNFLSWCFYSSKRWHFGEDDARAICRV
jgi:hypothetical protein